MYSWRPCNVMYSSTFVRYAHKCKNILFFSKCSIKSLNMIKHRLEQMLSEISLNKCSDRAQMSEHVWTFFRTICWRKIDDVEFEQMFSQQMFGIAANDWTLVYNKCSQNCSNLIIEQMFSKQMLKIGANGTTFYNSRTQQMFNMENVQPFAACFT